MLLTFAKNANPLRIITRDNNARLEHHAKQQIEKSRNLYSEADGKGVISFSQAPFSDGGVE
jgi:hypothetical protein